MSSPRPTDPAAQTPNNNRPASNGRFAKRNPDKCDNPVSVEAVVHALNESDTGQGAKPMWQPPSANGPFGMLPPRIRELAQSLFDFDPPSPNGEFLGAPSPNGDLRPRDD